jgi:hypothetical protein
MITALIVGVFAGEGVLSTDGVTMGVALFLAIVLGVLTGLHVFWAFGGSWGKSVAVPERHGAPPFRPSRAVTLLVVAGLLLATTCAVVRGGVAATPGDGLAAQVGCWVLAALFGARAVGEGRYVGFLKRVRNTAFARNDTWLYSPLCVVLSAGFLALALAR